MRKTLAILFSLSLVSAQIVAGVPSSPQVRQAAASPCCCNCGCCVTPASPGSAPAPAAPVRGSDQNQLSIPSPSSAAWTLPSGEAQIFSSFIPSSLTATDVPLYTRHCSRLV